MSVRVITNFSTHGAMPTVSAADGGFSKSEVDEAEDFKVRAHSDRPATVAISSLGCFRGIFWALAFEAGMVLAGFGVWEAWRLIR
jgi:hypothetical protein